MYCQKCGKYINDDSAFCSYCGTHFSYNTSKDSLPKPSVWEAVSVQVSPTNEQETINLYQKMGWILINSQEINRTTPYVHYVKLVFERDKSKPNYSILKNNYDMYCELKEKKEELEKSIEKHSRKFWISIIVPFIILFLISIPITIFFVYSPTHTVLLESSIGDEFDAFVNIFISSFINFLMFVITMIVALFVADAKKRKKITPHIKDISNKMQKIVDESEKYI